MKEPSKPTLDLDLKGAVFLATLRSEPERVEDCLKTIGAQFKSKDPEGYTAACRLFVELFGEFLAELECPEDVASFVMDKLAGLGFDS